MPDLRLRRSRSRDGEGTEDLTRKRFARRQWARRWLAWRVVLAVALVLLAVVVGTWLVFFSSVLAVKGVDVTGNVLLSDTEVRAAADIPTGEPLARTDLDEISEAIEELPAVRSVDVSRKWPDKILVKVEERVAVAVVEIGGTLHGMDEDGVVFREYAQAPKALPRIRTEAGVGDDVMAEGAAVVGVLPRTIARKVAWVELRSVDQITLELRDGRTVEWGSADRSQEKADVLAVLLQRKPKVQVYDVTVPWQPTTR